MDDGSPAKYLQCISYASWTTMGWQLLASLVVWAFGVCVVALLAKVYRGLPTPDWVHMWFGSPGVKPENQLLNANLRFLQLVCSSLVMVSWVYKSYLREASPGVQAVEFFCCLVFLLHLVFALIANGFSVAYALSYEGWLDAFTITPLLMQLGGGSYLTLAYLRTYRMNTAFVRLCGTGALDETFSEVTLVYVKKLIEFLMVSLPLALALPSAPPNHELLFFPSSNSCVRALPLHIYAPRLAIGDHLHFVHDVRARGAWRRARV
jgi:hypothetical protein